MGEPLFVKFCFTVQRGRSLVAFCELEKIMDPLHKRFFFTVLSLFLLVIAGIAGYVFIEGWPVLQAVYMTIITLTTTGFTDFNVSSIGKIFTILLLIGGAAIFTYSISTATALIIEGDLSDVWRRKKMEKAINSLEEHYVVCGVGDTGIHVVDELIKTQVKFVVIEKDKERIDNILETMKFLYIIGDATADTTLKKAGVEKAKGLVTTLAKDAENLFVVLSARGLNPKLRIISTGVGECCHEKLKKAGANEVILPEQIGGLRIASLLLRPTVVSFLDDMMRKEETIRFGEAIVREGSELIGLSIGASRIREKTGLMVVAVKKHDADSFIYNPSLEIQIHESDALIVIGSINQITHLKKITNDNL